MDAPRTKSWIERWEGRRAKVYTDSAGHPTIGIGFNLDRADAVEKIAALGVSYDDLRAGAVELSDDQIDALFSADLETAIEGARSNVSSFDGLPDEKQMVVVDLVFNLGASGFAAFKRTIAAIEAQLWSQAADEMEDSLWFRQVGLRAQADVALMRGPQDATAAPDATGAI